ncbi:nicotinamidase-related amidase [Rhizobium azibense]|nr:nicotinamidase-related amidase [Rhizobium azibense]
MTPLSEHLHSLGEWRHLCVDMQCLFFEATPWHVEWMKRVLPLVEEVAGRHAERTVFTRFIPPENAADMPGTWQHYYEKWWMMTRKQLPSGLIELVPSLARLVPPARVFDKATYSPWICGRLHATLAEEGVSTLVISGGETDVCVLAAVLGAIDLGYRVILLTDAVCSGADESHEASLELLGERFSVQLELTETDRFLQCI